MCFFGLRAFALPLPLAGAIVGGRLLEWRFKEGDRFNKAEGFIDYTITQLQKQKNTISGIL